LVVSLAFAHTSCSAKPSGTQLEGSYAKVPESKSSGTTHEVGGGHSYGQLGANSPLCCEDDLWALKVKSRVLKNGSLGGCSLLGSHGSHLRPESLFPSWSYQSPCVCSQASLASQT